MAARVKETKKKEAMAPSPSRPEWVDRGGGFFSGDRGRAFYGVGAASNISLPALRRNAAHANARAQLASIFKTHVADLLKAYSASTTAGDPNRESIEQHVQEVTKAFTAMDLTGSQIVDHYYDASERTEYALAMLDLKAFQDQVSKMKELDEQVKQAIRQNADKAFDELEEMEAKGKAPAGALEPPKEQGGGAGGTAPPGISGGPQPPQEQGGGAGPSIPPGVSGESLPPQEQGGGAGGAAPPGVSGEPQLPGGVSVGPGLRVVRWMTFRRITDFQRGADAQFIGGCKISANGSKILFSSHRGAYVIGVDGTGLTQISDKRFPGADISADGSRVAWFDQDGLFVAKGDGTGRVKLPGGFPIVSLRLTAKADRVIVLSPERGILSLPTDASDVNRLVSNADVAKVAGTDENGNYWRGGDSGIDISDDGSRIVFHWLWDAFAMNGDGTGLRKLTQFPGYGLTRVRISGDGRRIAYHTETDPQSTVTLIDWDGGNRVAHTGDFTRSGGWLQCSQDGGQVVLSWGLRLLSGDGKTRLDATEWGLPDPIYRACMGTISADLKRACLVVEGMESVDQGRPSQLVVVEFDPMTLNGAPPLNNISASPRFLLTDGSTNAAVSAGTTDPDMRYVGCRVLPGERVGRFSSLFLNDDGREGDEKGKDGTFTTDHLRLSPDYKVEAGPLTLRIFAFNKANHALVVDVEGVEARQP